MSERNAAVAGAGFKRAEEMAVVTAPSLENQRLLTLSANSL